MGFSCPSKTPNHFKLHVCIAQHLLYGILMSKSAQSQRINKTRFVSFFIQCICGSSHSSSSSLPMYFHQICMVYINIHFQIENFLTLALKAFSSILEVSKASKSYKKHENVLSIRFPSCMSASLS